MNKEEKTEDINQGKENPPFYVRVDFSMSYEKCGSYGVFSLIRKERNYLQNEIIRTIPTQNSWFLVVVILNGLIYFVFARVFSFFLSLFDKNEMK